MQVAVIGGGAAGFFAAIHAKTNHPKSQVTIFEKSKKFLKNPEKSEKIRKNLKIPAKSRKFKE